MILSWMAYAGTIAILFAVGALALEEVVRQRGWPIRWLWLGSLVGSAVVPTVVALESTHGGADTVHARSTAPGSGPAAVWQIDPAAAVPRVSAEIDDLLLRAWVFLTGVVLFLMVLSALSLRRNARRWRRQTVDGVDVWVAADSGPAVVGFLRRHIVLPEWILARPPAERSMVLAHECEHLRAHDPNLVLGAMILAAAFPWSPAIWWQVRRLRHAIEVDCDTRVLRRGVAPRPYSRMLLDVTEQGVAHRLAVAGLSESRTLLERRIRHMLTPKPRNWAVRATFATLLASGLVLLACNAGAPPAADERGQAGGAVEPGETIVEESLLLRCLSPGEAAEVIRPLLRLRANRVVYSPAHAPRVVTVHATPAQLRNVKTVLEEYESAGSSACAPRPAATATP